MNVTLVNLSKKTMYWSIRGVAQRMGKEAKKPGLGELGTGRHRSILAAEITSRSLLVAITGLKSSFLPSLHLVV